MPDDLITRIESAGPDEQREGDMTEPDLAEQCTIEIWPQREPGGQHVGSGPNGVKVTHRPSGTIACVESSRSQHTNKMIAMDMILAAITHPRYRP